MKLHEMIWVVRHANAHNHRAIAWVFLKMLDPKIRQQNSCSMGKLCSGTPLHAPLQPHFCHDPPSPMTHFSWLGFQCIYPMDLPVITY